jgi:hypothetical protein
MHRAARDQPAHAVGHDGEVFYGHGPVVYQQLQQAGEFVSVLRGVQAGVVAQVEWGVAQFLGQCGAVVVGGVPFRLPLQVIHAQAVNQQQHFAGGWQIRWQGLPFLPLVQGQATVAQAHGGGQRVAAVGQAVTHYAIECGQHGFALGRAGLGVVCRIKQGLQLAQHRVQAVADELRDALHAFVNQPGDATGLRRCFTAWCAQRFPDRLVHAFCNAGHAGGGLRCQLGHAPKVGRAQVL